MLRIWAEMGILVLFVVGLLILNVLAGELISFTGSEMPMKKFLKSELKIGLLKSYVPNQQALKSPHPCRSPAKRSTT